MSVIVDSLISSVTSQLTGSLSSHLGESEDSIKRGLETGSAALLGGIANRAGDSGFIGNIFNLATSFAKGNTPDLGSNFIGQIFGSQQSSITEMVSKASGLRLASAATLLTAAVPSVLGALGHHIQSSNLNPASLGSFLSTQSSGLRNLLPPSWTSALSSERIPTPSVPTVGKQRSGGWLLPLLALIGIIIVGGIVWLFSHNRKPVEDLAAGASNAASSAASSVASALGNFGKRLLPNNVELNIPQFGVENKLLDFIQSSNPVDETTWFDFDRLLFDTGSSTLQSSSQEQLQNVANILKAYPNVHVKLGGYTDNTGSEAANLKLSGDRAESVKNELVKLGVPESQLTFEGYGEAHPVADNSTEEGRAKNRRISMRVTAK